MNNLRYFVAFTRFTRFCTLFLCFALIGGMQQLAAQAKVNLKSITTPADAKGTPITFGVKTNTTLLGAKGLTTANSAVGATVPHHMRDTTNAQRKAAAAHAATRRAAAPAPIRRATSLVHSNAIAGTPGGAALTRDQLYFSGIYPNYANSPLPNVADTINCSAPNYCGIRKFIDPLPSLPVAVPDTITFPGSDYYEISLRQYTQKMHTDLPPTTLRGYVQTNFGTGSGGTNNIAPAPIQYLGPLIIATSNRPVRIKFTNELPTGTTPGPINGAPNGNGNLFIPVDKTVMGSGLGFAKGPSPYLESRATIHLHGGNTPWISDGTPHQWTVPAGNFTDGSTLYTRGASAQFVPDMFFDAAGNVIPKCNPATPAQTNCTGGTPAQLPAVAISNDPGPGTLTFFYTNEQSARLLFYHDHAYGTTRLNVYAGEAGGYLITDQVEQDMINGTNVSGVFTTANITPAPIIPATEIPLVIQDKTFVPPNPVGGTTVYSVPILESGSGYTNPQVAFGSGCVVSPVATATADTILNPWGQPIYGAVADITLTSPGSGCTSDPVVTITDAGGTGTGAAAFASLATLSQQDPTWDTTLWGGQGNLWYPHVYMPNQFPDNPDGSAVSPMGRWDYASWFWPVFNGQYEVRGELPCGPTMTWACPGTPSVLDPAPASFLASAPGGAAPHQGSGSTASLTPEAFMDTMAVNGAVYPTLTVDPKAYRFRILSVGNDRTLNLSFFMACGTGGYTPMASESCPTPTVAGIPVGTEVGMVPAAPGLGLPLLWPTDGRDGGVPDPNAAGPSWIQIGTEGGFLPAPAVIPPAPINYEYSRRSVTVTNTSSHSLNLMPAERADVIVDFSAYAGKTLILYNDAPAPYPAFDTRYDYYTDDPDQTGEGGAPTTLAGFGPNTRTVMQIKVNAATPVPYSLAPLNAVLPAAFKISQPVPVVPDPIYSKVYGATYTNHYPHLADTQLTFTPIGGTTPVTLPMRNKTIQELFEVDYGRMNATLGTELAFTNFNTQTTIPLGYVDPFTEDIYDSANVSAQPVGSLGDGSQVWEVIHNGVDSHAIHFHLYNVQLLDRVGWDGTVRAPDANEYGWKDTVRMNPLEIDFVALRPMSQSLPFPVPDSKRLLDVTWPAGATDPELSAFGPQNTAVPQTNVEAPLGWEYVWHCHILGHEENDMMRDQTFQVPPQAPTNLSVLGNTTGGHSTFTDNALSETGFTLQRADDANFTTNVVNLDLPPNLAASTNPGWNTPVAYHDSSATPGQLYYYRARSYKPDADFYAPGSNLVSAWSNTATTTLVPAATVNPTSLAFGNQLITTTSAARTVSLSNSGYGTLTVSGISVTGTNASYFAQTNNCVSLAAGNSCTISVTFTPAAIGSASAAISIASNDPVNPTVSVSLTGNGQKALTITASSTSVVYGSAVPAITPTLTGLAAGDTIANLPGLTCSSTYTATSPVSGSPYTSSCTGAVNTNYAITYVPGTVTVTKATASVVVNAATKVVNTANPVFTGTLTGFLSGVTATYTTTAVTSSPVGTYPITATVAPAVAANYNITYTNAQLTVTSAAVSPAIITPAPSSTLTGSTVTFTWSPGTGTTGYALYVGTTGVGSSNILKGAQIASLSTVVSGLPTAGGTVYVRLMWYGGGFWKQTDYTYTAFGAVTPAAITSPTPSTTLSGASVTFTWTGSNPASTQYALYVGTAGVGSSDIYKGAATTATSTTVSGIPIAGGTVYVRLMYYNSGSWKTVDYTYTAFNATRPGAITSPTPGTTLPGATATFTWSAPYPAPTQYNFWVGTTGVGSSNLVRLNGTTALSRTVTNLPVTGGTVYVRLMWQVGGFWQQVDYTYTAF